VEHLVWLALLELLEMPDFLVHLDSKELLEQMVLLGMLDRQEHLDHRERLDQVEQLEQLVLQDCQELQGQ